MTIVTPRLPSVTTAAGPAIPTDFEVDCDAVVATRTDDDLVESLSDGGDKEKTRRRAQRAAYSLDPSFYAPYCYSARSAAAGHIFRARSTVGLNCSKSDRDAALKWLAKQITNHYDSTRIMCKSLYLPSGSLAHCDPLEGTKLVKSGPKTRHVVKFLF